MPKTSMHDLAIFGGQPAFEQALHVGRPNIGDRQKFLSRVEAILDRNWLTNRGPELQEFERRVADLAGVRHCIAVCNATIGLEVVVRALELTGEVIVPSFTFVATAHVLRWLGLRPVFCDIDPQTHTLDPERVAAHIGPHTSAILGVHVWGRGCDDAALQRIAAAHGLHLLYDAAHAFGCTIGGRPIGSFGAAEVFSFHATKFLNTFEGGAIVTNDDTLADRLRLMINFGFRGYDTVLSVGTNGKMSEVAAAMGLTGLESLEVFIGRNRQNYQDYRAALGGLPGVQVMPLNGREQYNYQYVVVEVDERQAGLDRDLLVQLLHAENVLARRYFYPGCHQMQPYCEEQPEAGRYLPHTEALVRRVLTLPTGMAVGPDEVQRVAGLIRLIVEHAPAIRERLRTIGATSILD